jgi:aspartate/methionine/tyrosine aminotransferase
VAEGSSAALNATPNADGRGDADTFCKVLRGKYDTSVVPGRFFEMPDRVRIGIGGETGDVEEGLKRVTQAVEDLRN